MNAVVRHAIVLVCLLGATGSLIAGTIDDCHSGFSAYTGAQPYILNGKALDRRTTQIVAVFEDVTTDVRGAVAYRIEIRSVATRQLVMVTRGATLLLPHEQVEVKATWDGRDAKGAQVKDGEYAVEVIGQFKSGMMLTGRATDSEIDERSGLIARSSEIRVVVDHAGVYNKLFTSANQMREQTLAASLDPAFPYQFFFGTTHAHTNWSDGGMPVSSCTSGHYGFAGGAQPADAFTYAKTNGSIDFLAVVEHNHLMQDACASCTPAQILTRYQSGFTAAQTATVPGSFVGLWGMEWGVISNGGHVNLYNQNKLMSWSGEPFDVQTDKSNYPMMYTAMKNNQGTLGSYGTFNHPDSSDYGSYARSADGDAVMRGLSILSGPAFSTSTTFTPGGSTYMPRFNQALSYGWKIAPEAHQDNHCWNYGNSTPNRTVAVIPNGTTFNQTSLVGAYGARHFYAQQDRDAQLSYGTTDGAQIMGNSFSSGAGVPVTVKVSDPAGEGVQKIEIWGGRAGTNASPGAAPTIVASNTATSTLNATLSVAGNGETWYYYVVAVQADGNNMWSAPMWITWTSGCTLPGTASLSSPASGATGVSTSPTLSWSAVSGATSYDVYLGTGTPAFYQNTASTSVAASGLSAGTAYSWRVVAKNSCGSGTTSATNSFTTQASCTLPNTPGLTSPANGATGQSTSPTLSWGAVSGATSYDVYLGIGTPVFLTNTASTSVAASGLSSGTTYSWRVVAKNACGSGPTSVTRTFTTQATLVTILSEGAESGATGWTLTKNTGSGWSMETTADVHSGAKRFKTNVGFTTYLDGADWSVVSPVFSLAGKTASTLTFYNKYKTESGYDFWRVEISTNGGTTWTQLRNVSGQSTGYPSWAPQVSLSLSGYVGQTNLKLRFRFTSDPSIADWGVGLDDILVTAQ